MRAFIYFRLPLRGTPPAVPRWETGLTDGIGWDGKRIIKGVYLSFILFFATFFSLFFLRGKKKEKAGEGTD